MVLQTNEATRGQNVRGLIVRVRAPQDPDYPHKRPDLRYAIYETTFGDLVWLALEGYADRDPATALHIHRAALGLGGRSVNEAEAVAITKVHHPTAALDKLREMVQDAPEIES